MLAAITSNAQTEKKSDTLVISNWQQYKYIKIGDNIYQINSPTITEVKPNLLFPNLIQKWPSWLTPAGNNPWAPCTQTLFFADTLKLPFH